MWPSSRRLPEHPVQPRSLARKTLIVIGRRHVEISGIVSGVIIGLIIGSLGKWVVPGRQNMGCLSTMVVGVVAALLGSYLASRLAIGMLLEIVIQVGIAAVAVGILAGGSRRRR